PGGAALGADQLGDVIERDDITLHLLCGSFRGDADREIALGPAAQERDLVGDEPLPLLLGALHQPPNSGTASASGRPTRVFSFIPSSPSAERLTSVVVPSASRPTTPAVTPDSTASMNLRRSSSVVLAPTNASRWLLSSEVMVLKVEPS